jgi:hypothetical protein
MESVLFNPAVAVPLGAFLVAIVGIISGSLSQAHSRRMKAEERIALIARGVPLAEIEKMMGADGNPGDPLQRSPTSRMRGSRTASLVLIGVGLGLSLFGALLAAIVHEFDVLVVAAAGVIPLALGIAFFVDYRLQKAEVERLGV